MLIKEANELDEQRKKTDGGAAVWAAYAVEVKKAGVSGVLFNEMMSEEEALEVAQVPSHSPRLRSIELHSVRLRWRRTAAEKAGRHAQQETR